MAQRDEHLEEGVGAAPAHTAQPQQVCAAAPAPLAPIAAAVQPLSVEQQSGVAGGNAGLSSGDPALHTADGAAGMVQGVSPQPVQSAAGSSATDVVPAAHAAPGEAPGPAKRRRTGCRDISEYDTGEQIGEGTYG